MKILREQVLENNFVSIDAYIFLLNEWIWFLM